ncbi:hypothetical protein NM688_g6220 [Phlebia brevispora]|uniref:Uncharacterized protein n=1 Tax=Phlebia brevispora TaxID=194682 RepID=A0ACC1SIK4_9APHY|nr:hypothetical protein NM688_g6220 [Phlebia brevispora]
MFGEEPQGTTQFEGCPHLADIDDGRDAFIKKYKTVVTWYMSRLHDSMHHHQAKRRKIGSPACGTCNVVLSRPYVCLRCDYSGCWDAHVQEHLTATGHCFCVDAKSGCIFCSECDDFIYDADLAELYTSILVSSEERYTTFQDSKRKREPYKPWNPSAKDNNALQGAIELPCQGRRGLFNLGQTCFLNAILQSFVANPLLRNYFLSDKHNEKGCKFKDCTCCEMDRLFTEVYSGNTAPFGPTSFLTTTWRASSELSGYAQQDAHEFFISALNQIHATTKGSTKLDCICIVHTTFDGLLQSDVKCEKCGTVTSTPDPMLDISLEIESKGESAGQEVTLMSCLRRYTKPEKLGVNDYTCSKCGRASASKRLSIRRLPPVLSFQFKRFEHSVVDKASARKIEARVRFPSTLNMAEFTTLAMKSQEKTGRSGSHSHHAHHPGPLATYDYDLFSVVCHEGQIDNGHYTCFTRHQDEWYRFDDDKVTHSTLGACLNSQAYMCFYVKRHLDYKPYETPSYMKAREAEVLKEKEREREREREEAARQRELEDDLLATV